MSLVDQIKTSASGRWDQILSLRLNRNDHQGQPCPKCGGTDRFNLDREYVENGKVYCRCCLPRGTSDGIATFSWIRDLPNGEAIRNLANELNVQQVDDPSTLIDRICADKSMPRDAFEKFEPHLNKLGKIWVARIPVWNALGVKHSHFDLWPGVKGKLKPGKGTSGLFLPGRKPSQGEKWILVEGVKDAAALIGLGYPNVCGLPQSSMNETYAGLFSGCEITIVSDLDSPGVRGASQTASRLLGVAKSVSIARLPGEVVESHGEDVRDVLKRDGQSAVRTAIDSAEPWEPTTVTEEPATDPESRLKPINFLELVGMYPEMRPYIIDGVLRHGEIVNIIAATKIGKSFLGVQLAWCIATGIPWLSHNVLQGKVLILDNELHAETLADRIHRASVAMMVDYREFGQFVDVVPLRGKNIDIHELEQKLDEIEPGQYSLAIIDALYRTIPAGTSENDNAEMMAIYNKLDYYAAKWDCAIGVIHHTSKGEQGSKSITDVGSGAGAINRAADSMIIIRSHEDSDLCVLDCKTRSSNSPSPVSIRFDWPLWSIANKEPVVEKRQRAGDAETRKEHEKDKSDILSRLESGRIQQKDLVILYGGKDRFYRLIGALIKESKVRKLEIIPEGKHREQVWYELVK